MTKEESQLTEEVQNLLDQVQEERSRGNSMGLMFLSAFIVIILGFLLITRQNIEKSFSEQNIRDAGKKFLAVNGARMSAQLTGLAGEVVETLKGQFVNQWKEKLPSMGQILQKSSKDIETQIGNYTASRLTERILKNPNIAPLLASNNLTEQQIENVRKIVSKEAAQLGERISMKILELYQHDIDKLTELVATFPRDRRSTTDDAEAIRQLVHYLLQLADQEIMKDQQRDQGEVVSSIL